MAPVQWKAFSSALRIAIILVCLAIVVQLVVALLYGL